MIQIEQLVCNFNSCRDCGCAASKSFAKRNIRIDMQRMRWTSLPYLLGHVLNRFDNQIIFPGRQILIFFSFIVTFQSLKLVTSTVIYKESASPILSKPGPRFAVVAGTTTVNNGSSITLPLPSTHSKMHRIVPVTSLASLHSLRSPFPDLLSRFPSDTDNRCTFFQSSPSPVVF